LVLGANEESGAEDFMSETSVRGVFRRTGEIRAAA
jgi:hypothetical protein